MDYRIPYRDLPWGVAIMVLPGKIIGTLIIRPLLYFKRNKRYVLKKWLRRLYLISLTLGVSFASFIAINKLMDGKLLILLQDIWAWCMAL